MSWRDLALLVVLVGFATRLSTGLVFSLLSVAPGWSGIATLVAMYAAAVGTPVRDPRRRRTALAVCAFLPIAVAVLTMPASGWIVDAATGIVAGAVVFVLRVMLFAWRMRQARSRRRRAIVRRASVDSRPATHVRARS